MSRKPRIQHKGGRVMKRTIIVGTTTVVLAFGLTSAALAFVYPARFKDAKG